MAKRSVYTREELLQILQEIYTDTGRVPTYVELARKTGAPSVYYFKKEFGSWVNSLKEAGFQTNYENKTYTREGLIEDIHRYKREHGRIPTEKLMNTTPGYFSGSVYINNFGSWRNALAEAGYNVDQIYSNPTMDKIKRYDNETLLNYLRDFEREFGELPKPVNWFKMKDKPRRDIYIRRFGSWKNALIEAGFDEVRVQDIEL